MYAKQGTIIYRRWRDNVYDAEAGSEKKLKDQEGIR